MTSKHCFFNIMREDFRHKTWMLALSVLGNMLALPVSYLIGMGTLHENESAQRLITQARHLEEFFCRYSVVSGGVIAIAGAMIVGFFGFRYVFHRNMVDTYHSIPVKRRTLFLANWLNGFLIWFLPFLASLVLTLVLGLTRLSAVRGQLAALPLTEQERLLAAKCVTGGGLAAHAFVSLLTLTVAFILVYHLALLAVMLCGNLLNTLVTAATLGVGAISLYGLFLGFCVYYLETFVGAAVTGYRSVAYASPLVSAVVLLYRRVEAGDEQALPVSLVLNLAIALALGALALAAYLRRPSELAEQGIKIRPVKFLMQILVSFGAAMGGWMVFYLITQSLGDGAKLAWGVFGAVLAGVVAFGVLDVIFRMEFKAFFAHKALMAVTVAAGIITGFAFYGDWLGYDTYLPKQEDIAEIAVYSNLRTNNSYGYGVTNILSQTHPLNRVHIRDSASAYAFLESVVKPSRGGPGTVGEEIFAKVTLNSGRTYYRKYDVWSSDSGAAAALLESKEYLDVNFGLGREEIPELSNLYLYRGESSREIPLDSQEGISLLEAIFEAYNRDMAENPMAFIRGDGRQLCEMTLYGSNYRNRRTLEISEGMEHTREALRQHGLGEYADPMGADEVEEIRLSLGCSYAEIGADGTSDLTAEQTAALLECVGEVYGVWPEEETMPRNDGEPMADGGIAAPEKGAAQTAAQTAEYREIEVYVTEPAEIQELLELISYGNGSFTGGAFRPEFVSRLTLVTKEGREFRVSIPKGTLPEKYILRAVYQEEPGEDF